MRFRDFFIRIACFSLVVVQLRAQKLDSLLLVLSSARSDTHKVKTLHQIAKVYSRKDPAKAVEYARQSIALSDSLAYPAGKAVALLLMGNALKNEGDNFSPERYYKEAYGIFLRLHNEPEAMNCLSNLSGLYRNRGEFQQGISLLFRVLKYYETIGDQEHIAGTLNNIGNLYRIQKVPANALSYYRKAAAIAEKNKIERVLPVAYSNIGLVHANSAQFDSALYYYRKTYALDLKHDNLEGQAICLTNFAGVYDRLEVLDSAYYYFDRSAELFQQLGQYANVARQRMKIGTLYSWEKKYKEALKIYLACYADLEKTSNPMFMKEITFNLSEVYEHLGNSDKALQFHKEYVKWRDKVYNEENTRDLAQAEMKYEFDQVETENKMIQDKKDALAAEKDRRQQLTIWFSISGLLIVVAFSFYLFTRFRLIRQQKKIIENQKLEVMDAYDQLRERNKEVMDSIKYAQRIQSTLMSSEKYIAKKLKELKK